MKLALRLAVVAGLIGAAAGCDYSGDWLFAGAVEGVPGVAHLGDVVPAVVESGDDLDAAVIYGEVGPTGTAALGGVTLNFEGTGGSVCLWVDPEIVAWNQSVDALSPTPKWSYPDNVEDDGDLDMSAGLSVYYSGSPGETVGDFAVKYEDSLGEDVYIELSECTMAGYRGGYASSGGAHAGRGMPEYCTLNATNPGVSYTVLLNAWSTPLDDDRLGYGVLVADGSCGNLSRNVGRVDECMIHGEAVQAVEGSTDIWYGRGEVPTRPDLTVDGIEGYDGPVDVESAFCGAVRMKDWCLTEAEQRDCSVEPCLCGDPTDTPAGGSI